MFQKEGEPPRQHGFESCVAQPGVSGDSVCDILLALHTEIQNIIVGKIFDFWTLQSFRSVAIYVLLDLYISNRVLTFGIHRNRNYQESMLKCNGHMPLRNSLQLAGRDMGVSKLKMLHCDLAVFSEFVLSTMSHSSQTPITLTPRNQTSNLNIHKIFSKKF